MPHTTVISTGTRMDITWAEEEGHQDDSPVQILAADELYDTSYASFLSNVQDSPSKQIPAVDSEYDSPCVSFPSNS